MERRSVKILLLSFYFRPDLSAGSFRATALLESLDELAPPDVDIHVVTSLPNRYQSFKAEAPEHEQRGRVRISRIQLPSHRSGMVDQSRAYLNFARGALKLAKGPYDVVFATSGRLMTAALGSLIARRTGARLYLDIRDIFVDAINEIAAGPVTAVKPVLSGLERWTLRRAARVNLVSRGFAEYFEPRYPGKQFTYYTNGIDEEFVAAAPVGAGPLAPADGVVDVLYAGNLGEGQGLHCIIPALAERLKGRARFRIIGDGGRRDALEKAIASRGLTNVELSPPVVRSKLIEEYRAADVLFLHLNAYKALLRVLPSKLFEYAAMGKPVWAGVSGFSAAFLRTEVANAAVFPPCNVEEALRAFAALEIRTSPRVDFVMRFSRAHLSRTMASEILDLGARG
jgi:glycosyltransferase involved in cell wall biosynthesis